jgi:hypothetical protein
MRTLMLLNFLQLLDGSLRRQIAIRLLEPLAHHPIQHQRHETDTGVRLDPLRQAMEHRADLDLGFQHPKAPLDIRFSASMTWLSVNFDFFMQNLLFETAGGLPSRPLVALPTPTFCCSIMNGS